MFAVVIYSVTVMSVVIQGFNELLGDQDRIGGGYEVMAFSLNDTNPVTDLRAAIEANPDLEFVSRVEGAPFGWNTEKHIRCKCTVVECPR